MNNFNNIYKYDYTYNCINCPRKKNNEIMKLIALLNVQHFGIKQNDAIYHQSRCITYIIQFFKSYHSLCAINKNMCTKVEKNCIIYVHTFISKTKTIMHVDVNKLQTLNKSPLNLIIYFSLCVLCHNQKQWQSNIIYRNTL